jgi:molybdenum cofactor sulfurtransferase
VKRGRSDGHITIRKAFDNCAAFAYLATLAAMYDVHPITDGQLTAEINPITGYIENIDRIRESEYPSLRETIYLDHAGTTLYARSAIELYASELTRSLFGNPHSSSPSSQLSTRRIDDARLQVLRSFNADPNEFDVVFVANATSAIKLVADAFRDAASGFWYGYHVEAHTSLVGVRELATEGSRVFKDDEDVQNWISEMGSRHPSTRYNLQLFGYPGQSNMTGHKPPLAWCKQIRDCAKLAGTSVYTLYDAAGLLSTSSLDLSDIDSAPDFVTLSFYKIYGFPDLGALIVRKQSGNILRQRKYFAGGTVEMVTTASTERHAKKEALHSSLEDGTLAFHNIIALQISMRVHEIMFRSITSISKHAFYLAQQAYRELTRLKHCNGTRVCHVYCNPDSFEDPGSQGSVVCFNLYDNQGVCVGRSEVEKLATVQGIQLRTGGLCNPGGTAKYLSLSAEQLQHHYDSGVRCDDGQDSIDGKPTGTVRISFGAMSSLGDVKAFVKFIDEYYVQKSPVAPTLTTLLATTSPLASYFVESLSVYPVKSCAAFKVPKDVSWEVTANGLLWDREWCLVHEGTGSSLSQKRYPRMALLQPRFDFQRRVLIIVHEIPDTRQNFLEIGLDHSTDTACDSDSTRFCQSSKICGEQVDVDIYTGKLVASFFTEALGVPCTLARFAQIGRKRLAKPRVPRSVPSKFFVANESSIMLSNESPILLVSRSSVNRLNEQIKQNGSVGNAVTADSFRGNIMVAEDLCGGQTESPYNEDAWQSVVIGGNEVNRFEVMGPCQRCQMVCVDQKSARRRQEPFSTLAKTRRTEGKVYFGIHMCLAQAIDDDRRRFVRVGDRVSVSQ